MRSATARTTAAKITATVLLWAAGGQSADAAHTPVDIPAAGVGSIMIGDLLGVYAVDREFKFRNVPPIPAPRGMTVVTALNAATLEIRKKSTGEPVGWLYVDQYGIRFLQLRRNASDAVYRTFRFVKPTTPMWAVLPLPMMVLPRGYEIQRCATHSY